jgi:anti-anti-sigma regulatory factor
VFDAETAQSCVGSVTVTDCDGNGTWLVALQGEHDLSSASLLEQQTSPIWPRCKVAVIDLSQAGFVDSGIIKWLLSVARELEAAGAFTLSIVEGLPGDPAARLFALLGMRDLLACYPTREDAFAQVAARAA